MLFASNCKCSTSSTESYKTYWEEEISHHTLPLLYQDDLSWTSLGASLRFQWCFSSRQTGVITKASLWFNTMTKSINNSYDNNIFQSEVFATCSEEWQVYTVSWLLEVLPYNWNYKPLFWKCICINKVSVFVMISPVLLLCWLQDMSVLVCPSYFSLLCTVMSSHSAEQCCAEQRVYHYGLSLALKQSSQSATDDGPTP